MSNHRASSTSGTLRRPVRLLVGLAALILVSCGSPTPEETATTARTVLQAYAQGVSSKNYDAALDAVEQWVELMESMDSDDFKQQCQRLTMDQQMALAELMLSLQLQFAALQLTWPSLAPDATREQTERACTLAARLQAAG